MDYASVSRVLSWLLMLVGIGALLPAGVALIQGEDQQLFAFLATSLGLGTLSVTSLVLVRRSRRPARVVDGLGVYIMWWLIAPFAASLPFLIGVANQSVVSAVHEAVSCLTGTGHSVIKVAANDWPVSLIVWRGILHVLGAVITIVGCVCVLAALNPGGPGVHRTPIFSVSREHFFDGVPKVVRIISVLFTTLAVTVFIALLFCGLSFGQALAHSISAITTGSVWPDTLAAERPAAAAQFVMGIGLIFGALGAALWLPLRQRDWQALLTDPETLLFLALTGVFLLAVLPAGLGLADAAGWSIGALSTSGLAIAPPEATARVPLALAILPALVGGSALSAAGGFKLARLIVLAQRAGLEFRQLGFRRSVLRFDFRNRALDERSVFAVWIYIVGYIIAIFLTLVALSFFVPSLDESMRLATGAITNSGSLTRNTGGTLNEAAQAIMAFAMVLGRVEVLAFLPVFTVSFWRG